jgi:hypothetical protein
MTATELNATDAESKIEQNYKDAVAAGYVVVDERCHFLQQNSRSTYPGNALETPDCDLVMSDSLYVIAAKNEQQKK